MWRQRSSSQSRFDYRIRNHKNLPGCTKCNYGPRYWTGAEATDTTQADFLTEYLLNIRLPLLQVTFTFDRSSGQCYLWKWWSGLRIWTLSSSWQSELCVPALKFFFYTGVPFTLKSRLLTTLYGCEVYLVVVCMTQILKILLGLSHRWTDKIGQFSSEQYWPTVYGSLDSTEMSQVDVSSGRQYVVSPMAHSVVSGEWFTLSDTLPKSTYIICLHSQKLKLFFNSSYNLVYYQSVLQRSSVEQNVLVGLKETKT